MAIAVWCMDCGEDAVGSRPAQVGGFLEAHTHLPTVQDDVPRQRTTSRDRALLLRVAPI